MMPKKISVVVPTYKRPELLRGCLHHLLNQTFDKQQYEIIVVSDGPDAESQKVITECAACITFNICFLSLPNKKGPAAARNLGWKNSRGTLIAFTDDDCLPDNNWLKTIWDHYKNEKEIAYTGRVIVPVSDQPTDFELNTKGLESGSFVTANCAVSKAALEAIGGFDEAFTAAWREDTDIEFKLLNRGVVIMQLNEAIIVHPVRKVHWGVSMQEQKKTMYNALLYKKYPALYRQRIKGKPAWHYYFTVLFFILFIVVALLKIKWLLAIAFLCWLLLTVKFIFIRLSPSRKTVSHIVEMIVTSLAIPFFSVYWTLYGAVKYRVLFF